MKKSNFKRAVVEAVSIGGILWLNALTSAPPSLAAPDLTYNGNAIYKDSKDNVYWISPFNREVDYTNVQITKSPYADACGFVRVGLSNNNASIPTAITFNGTSDSIATIPIVTEKTPYKCVDGMPQWKGTPQTSVFQTSSQKNSAISKNIYYPPSRTGGALKQVFLAYTADEKVSIKANTCGFIVIPGSANSRRKTSGTFSVAGNPIDVPNLPVNPNPPQCVSDRTLVGGGNASQGGNTLYRTDKAIYLTGITPGSLNVVGYDALESKIFPIKSTCGLAYFSYKKLSPATVRVGGNTYTSASMTLSNYSIFDCASSAYTALPANALYKIDNATFVYKTSDLSLKRLVTEIPMTLSKNIAVNACGFVTIPSLNVANGFSAGDKVTINGSTPYNVTTLPLAPVAPLCRNGVAYTPAP